MITPTFSTSEPDTFTSQQTVFWYTLSQCNEGPAFFSLEVILPFAAWNVDQADFVAISVYDDSCATLLCRNEAARNGLCTFQAWQAGALYIQAANPLATSLPFSLRVTEANLTAPFAPQLSNLSACPANASLAKPLQVSFSVQVPVQVPSIAFWEGNQYQFFTCPGSQTGYLHYTALAVGPQSDFSSYLCLSSPCSPGQAVRWDTSGSAVNTIEFYQTGGSFGLLLQGWGDFNQTSTVALAVFLLGPGSLLPSTTTTLPFTDRKSVV